MSTPRVLWLFTMTRSGSSAVTYASAKALGYAVADEPFGPWDRTGPPYRYPPEQVELHKLSIRDFFIDLAREIAPSGSPARRLGTLFFLLYSGATTEAQNLKSNWPIDSAIDCIKDLISKETASAGGN